MASKAEETRNPELNPDSRATPLNVFPAPPSFATPFTSVTKTSFYNFYGSPAAFLADPSTALTFCREHTHGDLAAFAALLASFIRTAHADSLGVADQKAHCHITLWTWKTQPAGFGTPAWHRDYALYPLRAETMPFPRSKYCVTLLGQPTRFLLNTPQICETATKAYGEDLRFDEMAVRFNEAGFGQAAMAGVSVGQIARFTWGRDDSPVHAEPVIDRDRVFASVIFGNEEEIRGLADWREEKFVELGQ